MNKNLDLQKENVSVSGGPIVEVPYMSESGNIFFVGEYAQNNFCSQCGSRI
jgi:hypothetical protein